MHRERGRWADYLAALVVVLGACALLLAACDNGVPTPTPTLVAPSATAEAMPTVDVGATETNTDLDSLLTIVPEEPTSTPIPTPGGLDDTARAQIYVQVVIALLGKQTPPYVYISPFLGGGERLDEPDETKPLPEELLPALKSANSTPNYEIADFPDAIGPLDDGGKVKNNGVFITLGEIMGGDQDKSVVTVRGSIYTKVGAAEGDRFRLKHDGSRWKLINSTQEWTD